ARVAREPEVVVRAEHHALAALHLGDRTGLASDQAEVGDEIVLAGGFEQLHPLVGARLLEQVDCGFGHWVRCRALALEVRPVRSRAELMRFIRLPWRIYRNEPNWIPPLIFERKQFLNRKKNPFFHHGEAEYFLASRRDRVVGR